MIIMGIDVLQEYILKLKDRDIRVALKSWICSTSPDNIIRDELVIDGAIADVVTIGDSLHGYEIKSDADTLVRLQSQSFYYGRVMDYCTVVVGSKHRDSVSRSIPEYWGIVEAYWSGDCVDFIEHRDPTCSTDRQVHIQCQLLWKQEAISICKSLGLSHTGNSIALKRRIWHNLQPDDAHNAVITALKIRDWEKVDIDRALRREVSKSDRVRRKQISLSRVRSI